MFYAVHGSGRCGSDWTLICKDLKTIRGVKNRIVRGCWSPGVWYIYKCDESNFYKPEEHRNVYTLIKI